MVKKDDRLSKNLALLDTIRRVNRLSALASLIAACTLLLLSLLAEPLWGTDCQGLSRLFSDTTLYLNFVGMFFIGRGGDMAWLPLVNLPIWFLLTYPVCLLLIGTWAFFAAPYR